MFFPPYLLAQAFTSLIPLLLNRTQPGLLSVTLPSSKQYIPAALLISHVYHLQQLAWRQTDQQTPPSYNRHLLHYSRDGNTGENGANDTQQTFVALLSLRDDFVDFLLSFSPSQLAIVANDSKDDSYCYIFQILRTSLFLLQKNLLPESHCPGFSSYSFPHVHEKQYTHKVWKRPPWLNQLRCLCCTLPGSNCQHVVSGCLRKVCQRREEGRRSRSFFGRQRLENSLIDTRRTSSLHFHEFLCARTTNARPEFYFTQYVVVRKRLNACEGLASRSQLSNCCYCIPAVVANRTLNKQGTYLSYLFCCNNVGGHQWTSEKIALISKPLRHFIRSSACLASFFFFVGSNLTSHFVQKEKLFSNHQIIIYSYESQAMSLPL